MRLRDRGQKRESTEAGVVTSTAHAETGNRLRRRRAYAVLPARPLQEGPGDPTCTLSGGGRTASANHGPTSGYKLLIYSVMYTIQSRKITTN